MGEMNLVNIEGTLLSQKYKVVRGIACGVRDLSELQGIFDLTAKTLKDADRRREILMRGYDAPQKEQPYTA